MVFVLSYSFSLCYTFCSLGMSYMFSSSPQFQFHLNFSFSFSSVQRQFQLHLLLSIAFLFLGVSFQFFLSFFFLSKTVYIWKNIWTFFVFILSVSCISGFFISSKPTLIKRLPWAQSIFFNLLKNNYINFWEYVIQSWFKNVCLFNI